MKTFRELLKEELDSVEENKKRNLIKNAKRVLRLKSDIGASMSKNEAREILKGYEVKFKEPSLADYDPKAKFRVKRK